MAGAPMIVSTAPSQPSVGAGHPLWRRLLIAGTVLFLTLFIVLPVVNVFHQALSKGVAAYGEVFSGPGDAIPQTLLEKRKASTKRAQAEKNWSAIRMSAGIAAVVVPLNIVFGLMAAWTVCRWLWSAEKMTRLMAWRCRAMTCRSRR